MANQKNMKKCDVKDETGVFGCTCRHGIPLRFLNLKSMGEKYVSILKVYMFIIIKENFIIEYLKLF